MDQPGTISGQTFNDLDADGTQDEGEPGIQGWTIFLDTDGDSVLDAGEQRTTTDADGNFTFTGLAPGTYRVREVQQAGFVQTTCNPADITVCADGDVGGMLFGNFQMISISGTKFRDANGNGVRDAGETGLGNWVIFLDTNDNGSLDVGEKRTRTDANGNFRFTNLGPGSYHVREVVQLGWIRMTDNPACIVATSGVNVCGLEFGNMPVTAVGGVGGGGGVAPGNAGKLLLTGGNLSSLQNSTFARQVQWVANLYQRMLGEAPDLAGLREYVRLLQLGFTPQQVAAIFIRRHS